MAKYLDSDGLLYFWQKLKTVFAGKVDKVEGKGLSTNDYTGAEKSKLAGIGSSWQGEAASAFTSVMSKWDTEARKVTDALTELHSAMRSSDTKMKANEAEQAATMNKYGAQLL